MLAMEARKKSLKSIVFSQLVCEKDCLRRNRQGISQPKVFGYRVWLRVPEKVRPQEYQQELFTPGVTRRDIVCRMRKAARLAAERQKSCGKNVIQKQVAPILF
jgi:hypothetical protein